MAEFQKSKLAVSRLIQLHSSKYPFRPSNPQHGARIQIMNPQKIAKIKKCICCLFPSNSIQGRETYHFSEHLLNYRYYQEVFFSLKFRQNLPSYNLIPLFCFIVLWNEREWILIFFREVSLVEEDNKHFPLQLSLLTISLKHPVQLGYRAIKNKHLWWAHQEFLAESHMLNAILGHPNQNLSNIFLQGSTTANINRLCEDLILRCFLCIKFVNLLYSVKTNKIPNKMIQGKLFELLTQYRIDLL